MATEQSTPDKQDAEQLRKALAHIEQMQQRLDGMRSTLEDLVQPLANSRHKTTSQITRETQENALKAISNMKQLKSAWESDQTKVLLSQAQQSANANPDMTPATTIPLWGWTTSD